MPTGGVPIAIWCGCSFDVGSFTLCDFGLPSLSEEVVYSEMLHAHGLSWRLKVYPNGNGVARNSYVPDLVAVMHSCNRRVLRVAQSDCSVTLL